MPIISTPTAFSAARISRTLATGITIPRPVDRSSGKNPDNRLPPASGQARGDRLRTELATQQLANKTASALQIIPSRQLAPQQHLGPRRTDEPDATARLSRFFLDIIRTDAQSPERQARELQAQTRRLPQLGQAQQADGFNLILALSNKLPVHQQAPLLAALAPRLRTLPTSARRSGFEALATSVARLSHSDRAVALPALARALAASGHDAGTFHAVRVQTQTLNVAAQTSALPGLIRHIGVLPQDQRQTAFDALALQVQTLPPLQQRNALRGLAGKISRLPADQQAPATARLHEQAERMWRA